MTAQDDEQVGGKYRLFERLGEGAFARVYRARDAGEDAIVAVKILKESSLAQPEIVERFRREVFAVASVSSPFVVELKDFGLSDGSCFAVTEYVEGPTLRQAIERTWSREGVLTLVAQVGHALEALHKSRILHRDLKPENILLQRVGSAWRAKVVDFGFAKLLDLEHELALEPITRAGFCFGTPEYMSPEQIRGKAVDERTDLYALGVIAYEIVAGRRPWDNEDPRQVMRAVVGQDVPPLPASVTSGDRRAELDRFFARALAKDPAGRPPSAAAFVEEFEQALIGSSTLGMRAATDRPLELTGFRPDDITDQVLIISDDITSLERPPQSARPPAWHKGRSQRTSRRFELLGESEAITKIDPGVLAQLAEQERGLAAQARPEGGASGDAPVLAPDGDTDPSVAPAVIGPPARPARALGPIPVVAAPGADKVLHRVGETIPVRPVPPPSEQSLASKILVGLLLLLLGFAAGRLSALPSSSGAGCAAAPGARP